jgi:hypothetical protein
MRFRIERRHLDALDQSVLYELLAEPIGHHFRLPRSGQSSYSANSKLLRPQVNVFIIGDAIAEVLNGGLLQLILNSSGAYLADLPGAFLDVGRPTEAKILNKVCAMFPDAVDTRNRTKRAKYTTTKIVPGGFDGIASGAETSASRTLDALDDRLAKLVQSRTFFKAVAGHVCRNARSFDLTDAVTARTLR